jgi:hypothetical protein
MKDFKYTLMISIAAFLMGARPDRFGATVILPAANRAMASSSAANGPIGSDKTVHGLPATDSRAVHARTFKPHEIARADDELSNGTVEEYAGAPGDDATQGSGYADVFDSNGHLLWRFATVQHDDSKWTILKYFSDRAKRTNLETGQAPQPGN